MGDLWWLDIRHELGKFLCRCPLNDSINYIDLLDTLTYILVMLKIILDRADENFCEGGGYLWWLDIQHTLGKFLCRCRLVVFIDSLSR